MTTAGELIDKLDWRLTTLQHLEQYAGQLKGEPAAEQILECMGMLISECRQIVVAGEVEPVPTIEKEGHA